MDLFAHPIRAVSAAPRVFGLAMSFLLAGGANASDPADRPEAPAAAAVSDSVTAAEVARLRMLVSAQQKQLDRQRVEMDTLRLALDSQQKLLDRIGTSAVPASPDRARPAELTASAVPALPP